MAPGNTAPQGVFKVDLRNAALARRAEESARSGPTAAERVRDHVLELVQGLAGSVVSAYLPIRDELDPRPLMDALRARGRVIGLPCIEGKDRPLIFRSWSPGDPLEKADFGTRQPLRTARVVIPGIMLVPLAAFDKAGNRIGYGGGYYDRSIAASRASMSPLVLGLAFDAQEVPEFQPEPHDQRLDGVVTPSGARCFGKH